MHPNTTEYFGVNCGQQGSMEAHALVTKPDDGRSVLAQVPWLLYFAAVLGPLVPKPRQTMCCDVPQTMTCADVVVKIACYGPVASLVVDSPVPRMI